MDPPYKEKNLSKILTNLVSERLNNNGIIISDNVQDQLPSSFKIIEDKIYGISRVFFGS